MPNLPKYLFFNSLLSWCSIGAVMRSDKRGKARRIFFGSANPFYIYHICKILHKVPAFKWYNLYHPHTVRLFNWNWLRRDPPLFLASNAFSDVGSVGQIEKQKQKKNHKKSRNRRPWYPRTTWKVNIHVSRLTQYTVKNVPVFVPVFLYTVLYTYFRRKELFQVKSSLTTSLLFFFGNGKNLGRSDDTKRRKKEDGLIINSNS